LLAVLVLVAGGWSAFWYYGAGKVETTIAGWKEREARAGRIYTCATQSIGGFPFGIEVLCADFGAEIKSAQPPLAVKARDLRVTARVYEPTVLTTEFTGPLTIAEPGQPPGLVANWRYAQSQMHGLPIAPESTTVVVEQPTLERAADRQMLFKATRLDLKGRMLEGSARSNPVIEIAIKLAQASAPTTHAVLEQPLDADIIAVLRGLKDFGPKPWPERFREIQASGGRIEIVNARLQQGEAIAVANGALGLTPNGRLTGQLRVTVANLDRLLPAFGLGAEPPQASTRGVGSALDRLSPGLGNFARQNAGSALAAGLAFFGQATELEGRRAHVLPLRFNDGSISLGPIPLGQVPPLF
jgi:hypothetical protein